MANTLTAEGVSQRFGGPSYDFGLADVALIAGLLLATGLIGIPAALLAAFFLAAVHELEPENENA